MNSFRNKKISLLSKNWNIVATIWICYNFQIQKMIVFSLEYLPHSKFKKRILAAVTIWVNTVNDTSLERCETKRYLFSLFLRFLDGGGMDLFLHCKERFPNKNDLLRNMMGLLGNVAEVCTVCQKHNAQWYMRVQRVKIKVFQKPLFNAVSTWICYFGSVDTNNCWFR